MSSEFVFFRCSTQLSEAIEKIGKPAFDAFWDGDLISDNETWTQEKIQEIFSVEERQKLDSLLGKFFIPILREGQKTNGYLISPGDFIEAIHFLLAGKRQLTICDFLTKELLLGSVELSREKLILVNVIKGGCLIERGNSPDATLLVSSEVREIIDSLKIILEDDFESRWKILKEKIEIEGLDFSSGFGYRDFLDFPKTLIARDVMVLPIAKFAVTKTETPAPPPKTVSYLGRKSARYLEVLDETLSIEHCIFGTGCPSRSLRPPVQRR